MADIIPLPTHISLTWAFLFIAGAVVGFRLRKAVMAADQNQVLVGFDWGILVGAFAFYISYFGSKLGQRERVEA